MAGQGGHAQHYSRGCRPSEGPARERQIQRGKRQRQPGRHGQDVEVADMGNVDVRKHEGQGGSQRRRQAQAERRWRRQHNAHQHIHAGSGQPDVQRHQPLHGHVRQRRPDEKQDQVDGVKNARLVVGGEGRAGIERGVPQRDAPGVQGPGGVRIGRPEEGDQVAAAAGDPALAKA